ncbi:integrase, catalytic region, zinc finger, CCHC-type containing protein [Tanacetum coccineum]
MEQRLGHFPLCRLAKSRRGITSEEDSVVGIKLSRPILAYNYSKRLLVPQYLDIELDVTIKSSTITHGIRNRFIGKKTYLVLPMSLLRIEVNLPYPPLNRESKCSSKEDLEEVTDQYGTVENYNADLHRPHNSQTVMADSENNMEVSHNQYLDCNRDPDHRRVCSLFDNQSPGEGFLHNTHMSTEWQFIQGSSHARVLNDMSAEKRKGYKADIRATNILLQGRTQCKQQGKHFKKQLREGNVVAGNVGGQNRGGIINPGPAKPIKCYNYNGLGHIARECPRPKRLQDSDYFKDKMLLIAILGERSSTDE